MRAVVAAVWVVRWPSTQSFRCDWFCLATNQIAQTGLSSLPPVIYYSEQLFRVAHQTPPRLLKPQAYVEQHRLCSPAYCCIKSSSQSFPWAIWMLTALLWVGMLKMTVRKLTGMVTSPEKPNEQRGLFRVFFIKKN